MGGLATLQVAMDTVEATLVPVIVITPLIPISDSELEVLSQQSVPTTSISMAERCAQV